MKEIIQSAVVIDPAFRGEVTLVTVKKGRIFIMLFKVNQRKMVSLRECTKLRVIIFAGRTRYPLLIVNVTGDRHTEQ